MGIFRLLLALSVVLDHGGGFFGVKLLPGPAAVEVFFMISGFYMALILTEKYRGPGSYRLFITNRFLRIYPVYWVAAGATVAVWIALNAFFRDPGPLAAGRVLGASASSLVGLSNVAIFGQDLLMFLYVDAFGRLHLTPSFQSHLPQLWTFSIDPPAWSLSLELCFYLLAPLVVRGRTRLVAALAAASFALRGVLYFGLGLRNDPWTYRFFPTELFFFLAGIVAYRIYGRARPFLRAAPSAGRWVAAGLLTTLLVYDFLPATEWRGMVLKQWAFYALAWAAIPPVFELTRSSSLDGAVGELSYPVYVVHWAMMMILWHLFARFGVKAGMGAPLAALTIACSLVLVRFVSAPIERLRKRRAAGAGAGAPPAAGPCPRLEAAS